MPDKKCRKCAMMIPKEAKVCPFCRKSQGISPLIVLLFLIGGLFLVGIIVSQSEKISSPPSSSSAGFQKKYIFVKALDETMYKDMGGIFNKVEIGTTDRVEITLDIRNKLYYGMAKKFVPQCREAGFKVLRIKDTNSDRFEDFPL